MGTCKIININENVKESSINSISYKGIYYNRKYDKKHDRYYIDVENKKLYLDKNNNVAKKQFGKKSEVYAFQTIEEIKGMIEYFIQNEMWQSYLWFVLGINMARRAGDTRNLTWEHFFNGKGQFRKYIMEIKEEKTDKFANPKINNAVQDAIKLYCEKLNINPMKEYKEYVFLNRRGTHKGRLYTEKAYGESLKKAADAIGIEYNINTHSTRKTFGKILTELNPNDPTRMQVLQEILNHSNEKVTSRYIGLSKDKIDEYYDSMGTYFTDYVIGDKEYIKSKSSPVITIYVEDLRDVLNKAYEMGVKNRRRQKVSTHIKAITELMKEVEEKSK